MHTGRNIVCIMVRPVYCIRYPLASPMGKRGLSSILVIKVLVLEEKKSGVCLRTGKKNGSN